MCFLQKIQQEGQQSNFNDRSLHDTRGQKVDALWYWQSASDFLAYGQNARETNAWNGRKFSFCCCLYVFIRARDLNDHV